MNASLQIGKLAGIPVKLHWSFLLVIPLFAWIIGSQIRLTTELIATLFGVPIDVTLIAAGLNPYILGSIVALGLFVGVFIHESLQLAQQFGRTLGYLVPDGAQLTVEKLFHKLMQDVTTQRPRPDYTLAVCRYIHDEAVDRVGAAVRVALARTIPDNRC